MDRKIRSIPRNGHFYMLFGLCMALTVITGATEYYVDGVSGDDTYDGTTWNDAKKTIAAGLALATENDDVVNIAPDPCAYVIDATLVPDPNNIIIQGNNFGAVADPTTVILTGDVNGDDVDVDLSVDPCALINSATLGDNVQVFNLSGSPGITIKNLTITKSVGAIGGAVNMSSNARATFENVHFIQNWASDDGGVFALKDSENLTLTGCVFCDNACYDNGGTIFAIKTSTLTISGCDFGPAQGHDSSPGILTFGMPTVTITDSYFHDLYNIKLAQHGGAIHARFDTTGSKTITIDHCVFENCSAAYYGGAVYFQATDSLKNYTANISHCLVFDCSNYLAGHPAAAFWCENKAISCSMTANFDNCTIAHNDSTTEGAALGVYSNGQPVTVNLTNSIIWGNTGSITDPNQIWYETSQTKVYLNMDYCCIYDPNSNLPLPDGIGNLFVDPNFADPENGDFHLKSQAGRWISDQQWVTDSVTSPCIDTGNPGAPLGDEPADPNNQRINMGCYGRTDQASKTPLDWAILTDINNDYQVDALDLELMLDWWLESRPYHWAERVYHENLDGGDPNFLFSPHLTDDQLTLYYHRYESAIKTYTMIKADRTSTSGSFTVDRELSELGLNPADPWISEDGQRLYFTGEETLDGQRYIKMAQWNSVQGLWEVVQTFDELHVEGFHERSPSLTLNELTMYWASNNPSGLGRDDIWRATRLAIGDPFGSPVNVTELNTSGDDTSPHVLPDDLTICFASDRSSTTWRHDIFLSDRTSASQPFDNIRSLTNCAVSGDDETDPYISRDGRKVFLKIGTSDQGGIYEMDWEYYDTGEDDEYPGNFNRNEFVNMEDVWILFGQWGQF